MPHRPRDRESVVDDLEVIDVLADEPMSTARAPEPEDGDKDRPPRRRRLLVLAIAALVIAMTGVFVATFRDDGEPDSIGIASEDPDAEREPRNRGTSSACRPAPEEVPG